MNNNELRDLRGHQISMIFQDPVAGLNPILEIGDQIVEIIMAHRKVDKREARQAAIDLLQSMGLADAPRLVGRYPFQLSGGMAQRVMIAIAMALQPAVLIADEPTSALDMTIQAQILQELRRLRDSGVAILLITHDMGVIAQMADRVAVMYAGRLAEEGDPDLLFKRPRHPYTWALLDSLAAPEPEGAASTRCSGPPARHDQAAGRMRLPCALPQGDQRLPDAGLAAVDRNRAGPGRRLLQPGVPAGRRRGRRRGVASAR